MVVLPAERCYIIIIIIFITQFAWPWANPDCWCWDLLWGAISGRAGGERILRRAPVQVPLVATQDFIRICGAPGRSLLWRSGNPLRVSALGVQAPPWIPELLSLKQRVEAATPIAAYKNLLLPAEGYNAVLCNLYRDGSDSVGVHADTLPGWSGRRSTDSIARLAALPAY